MIVTAGGLAIVLSHGYNAPINQGANMSESPLLLSTTDLGAQVGLTHDQTVRALIRAGLLKEYLIPIYFPDTLGGCRHESLLWPTQSGEAFCALPSAGTRRQLKWAQGTVYILQSQLAQARPPCPSHETT
jgi:hypothetical protein